MTFYKNEQVLDVMKFKPRPVKKVRHLRPSIQFMLMFVCGLAMVTGISVDVATATIKEGMVLFGSLLITISCMYTLAKYGKWYE